VKVRPIERALFVAILLSECFVVRAEQQPDAVVNSSQASQAAQVSPVTSGASAANVALVLRPTEHPRVPRDLSQLWMAPEKGRVRTAAQANLATAIKFEADGSHAKALTLLSNPATAQKGPLAAYVEYYKGLAQLHSGQAAAARATFQGMQALEMTGFLVEASALREAECDDELGDYAAAIIVYERLAAMKTTAPEEVLTRLAKAAKALGDEEKARAAFERVYYEYPFSEQSAAAADELGNDPIVPGNPRVRRELARAERLFAARQYTPARAEFERLRNAVQGDDRDLVRLRLAEADFHLKRFKAARDGVRPYIDGGPRQSEALYFYALSLRELDDRSQYLTLLRRVISDFPADRWAEEALNNLATTYIREDQDDLADRTFRDLYERFPKGKYAERAAWKIGWKAYRNKDYRETAYVFSRASGDFPRSDYRPSWLYWAGRAHEALGEKAQAQARYTVAALDYQNSYHGRLALARLDTRLPERRLVISGRGAATPAAADDAAPASSLPPNAAVVRELLVAKIYEQAIDELRYAQSLWGDSSPIGATIAWTYREQGKAETGSQQFSLYRGAINLMKRAYPQYLAAGGEQLPRDILRVIYPIAFWDLIQKNSLEHGLDPYLVAALAAQESTFVANIRSPAKATGVLQLASATARQYAKRLDMKWSSSILTDPEANIRIGTAYLADKIREFGDLHLVLASYNAGERPVYRWLGERPGMTKEEFIDDIPYPETQGYVRKILGTAEDYRRIYGSAAGLAGDDEIPRGIAVEAASDVDPSLTTRRSSAARPAAAAKPEAVKPPPVAKARPVAKKKAAVSSTKKKASVTARKKPAAATSARMRRRPA
jgi:soluble lytic murein transglycosylase